MGTFLTSFDKANVFDSRADEPLLRRLDYGCYCTVFVSLALISARRRREKKNSRRRFNAKPQPKRKIYHGDTEKLKIERPTVKVKTSTQRNFGGRGELRKENSSRHGTNLIVSSADGRNSLNVPFRRRGHFQRALTAKCFWQPRRRAPAILPRHETLVSTACHSSIFCTFTFCTNTRATGHHPESCARSGRKSRQIPGGPRSARPRRQHRSCRVLCRA